MASADDRVILSLFAVFILIFNTKCSANDILGCGGFVKSHVKLDYSEIEIGLYTKEGSLKEKTECAPTNGYYFLPLYEKGDYVLRVHPPAGLSFEPSQVELSVDGVTDRCSTGQDINFSFSGFGINGKVVTAGQQQGPSGVAVQLVNEKGEKRNTVTAIGGEFHFTAVIPGKYTVKATHPKWKLEPSQVEVQMKEGKMAPVGVVLTVKGYDVSGSVSAFGSPIQGMYVLLYAKVDPKFRVEGCNTALLQGVPDAPICHVTTDASGEFMFGLVPAGEYKLVALANTPGKPGVSYNVRPDAVPFTVRHDSLYIKNAFEVTGFTVIGKVEAKQGKGLSGARVLLDGTPVDKSDAEGRFTLDRLQPGLYTVSFQHEECEIEDIQVRVENNHVKSGVGRANKWRVCGEVAGGAARHHVAIWRDSTRLTHASVNDNGKWCIYLPPGVYTAKVEVSEQDQREGLQFYPPAHQVSVAHAPVSDVTFSQLRAQLSGQVVCDTCRALTVTLRSLSPDGNYIGTPITTHTKDGSYKFSDIPAGSVEVSVEQGGACWRERTHRVSVARETATVPTFTQVGYVVNVHSSHDVEVEYESKSSSGSFPVPRGVSSQCVPARGVYSLTPKGCHLFSPATAKVDVTGEAPPTVHFVATAHAVTIHVTCPEAVPDLRLTVTRDSGTETAGPLAVTTDHPGHYVHTVYMLDGEVGTVSAWSSSLVFHPAVQQVVGTAACQPHGAYVRAVRALSLAGTVRPPRAGYTVTLHSDEGEIAEMVTSADGKYHFGPLDASKNYRVEAKRESYIFSEPDEEGNIVAQKLAEILVRVVDDVDGKPLQGALVSVSGDTYRRNVVSTGGAGEGTGEGEGEEAGALRFPALSAGQYYVKPNMKEYRFLPPHQIVHVEEGKTHTVTLRGVRVAWSCRGALVSLAGAGWGGAALVALPAAGAPSCAPEEATTETSGAFRIRGLLPECEYKIQLKESALPELAGLRLAKAPASLKVQNKRDISGVRVVATQPGALTDALVRVRAPLPHYRTLRLALAAHAAHAAHSAHTAHLYSTKVDAAGYTLDNNPGVLYVLPRLPADNKTYAVKLESSLPRSSGGHDLTQTFVSDGRFKHIEFEFIPKIKSTEQELRHSSLLLVPLVVGALLYKYGARLYSLAPQPGRGPPRAARPARGPAAPGDLLDAASIDHIVTAVNAAGNKPHRKLKAA